MANFNSHLHSQLSFFGDIFAVSSSLFSIISQYFALRISTSLSSSFPPLQSALFYLCSFLITPCLSFLLLSGLCIAKFPFFNDECKSWHFPLYFLLPRFPLSQNSAKKSRLNIYLQVGYVILLQRQELVPFSLLSGLYSKSFSVYHLI
ncbi:hypothetical protein V8C37DRAFT_286496 [Trichoderma ceciliae]